MVRVNNKPQHVVFCWCFAHLLSKRRHLPVESRKWPCLARCRAVCFALKSGQISGPSPIPEQLSKGSPLPAPSQGAELVQNRASPVRNVDIRAGTGLSACPKLQTAISQEACAGVARVRSGSLPSQCGRTRHVFRARTGAAQCSPNRSPAPFLETGQAPGNTLVIRWHIAPPAPRSIEVWCTG